MAIRRRSSSPLRAGWRQRRSASGCRSTTDPDAKCASLARIAATLVETYLGRDAGRRVLEGRIARGVADRIGAVLWFSDLRDFTQITDTAPPEQVLPLLNDWVRRDEAAQERRESANQCFARVRLRRL